MKSPAFFKEDPVFLSSLSRLEFSIYSLRLAAHSLADEEPF